MESLNTTLRRTADNQYEVIEHELEINGEGDGEHQEPSPPKARAAHTRRK